MQRNSSFVVLLLVVLSVALGACQPVSAPAAGDPARLLLATTTSTQDSGLLDAILPDFERQHAARVDVVAAGTGQALQLGRDCNADVLLVHAPALEAEFMAQGAGVRRAPVMYNDFVIVGPPGDPAGIKGLTNAATAFAMIAAAQAPFISRGDDSGTHAREMAVWQAAGIEPAGDWYIAAGQGMGAVLTLANEQQAYALSDRATYLARTRTGIDLAIMVEGDPSLFNPYSAIIVNPERCPHVNVELANRFVDWLVSVPTQAQIAAFGQAELGQSLFIPDSDAWRNR